ncbi:hypothetical protein NERG_00095 [Nematocida ausubeli]|uniref:Uncharacterized protein n=1 Tax=Nematocida ausubeli (strain ATCC PRA-371 / ERTm2) TaxID=1913371 RepID=H8Z924_NEMA1|nr:hypothetical protein NERG_00095 [Nematocida ausubeli]
MLYLSSERICFIGQFSAEKLKACHFYIFFRDLIIELTLIYFIKKLLIIIRYLTKFAFNKNIL